MKPWTIRSHCKMLQNHRHC